MTTRRRGVEALPSTTTLPGWHYRRAAARNVSHLDFQPWGWSWRKAARVGNPAHFDGAGASLAWSIPFAGLLLSIALLPLIAPHSWEHHFGKVAAFWSFALIIPMVATSGFWTATTEILHVFLLDYLPFIILLFALFVVAGGIRVGGNLVGTPATNTAMLAFGTLSASFLGTTGASMVLIRPIIRANQGPPLPHPHLRVLYLPRLQHRRLAHPARRPAALSRLPQGRRLSSGRWKPCCCPCCS